MPTKRRPPYSCGKPGLLSRASALLRVDASARVPGRTASREVSFCLDVCERREMEGERAENVSNECQS